MSKLIVTVQRDGFRRLGRSWFGHTEIDSDDFSEQEIAALEADPMFTVEPAGLTEEDPLLDSLVGAISQLDIESGFDRQGRPKVAELSRVVGVKISAAERDQAWARFQSLQEVE